MNLPNKLTMLRIIAIPFFAAVLLGNFLPYSNLIAAAIFALAAFTDWLDGYLARKMNLVTNFGKFADPLADKLLVAAALICFVELKSLAAWVVIIMISREFIVTGLRLLAADKNIVLAADFSGKLKTATQMVMIIFILLDFSFFGADIVKNVLVIASVVFSLYSCCEYIVKNRKVFSA
ncbi:MAG: CDP-diacylglycerol--glycerol-3-phosphate 3-phosphatidyltransferase [Clostridiales bacterium]|nr:CDP-diacylglycerol--glycerol-3-phosphate 3-phosphatidyltransferase [Clostridiales bacterium]